jgi:hypothetical protein
VRFFFYGTLIDADVRRLVLGGHAPAAVEQATLKGWRCVPLADVTYPTIVRDGNGSVPGVLARGLSDAARQALVRYEGEEYDLLEVEVSAASGKTLPALIFAMKPGEGKSAPGVWDLALWQRRHKRRFLAALARSGSPS